VTPERAEVLEEPAKTISAAAGALMAIGGLDAAGKTTLADELAARLGPVVRVPADSFLRAPGERYALGRESALGY
jgi:uridine kinase